MKWMGSPPAAHCLCPDGRLVRLLPSALRASTAEWLETGLLMLTDLDRDFLGLALVDPDRPDAVMKWLFIEDHDVEGVVVDPGKTKAAVIVNDGIYDSIRVIALDDGRELDRLLLPPGVTISDHSGDAGYHVSWSGAGARLFVSGDRPTQPAEIYEWPVGARWTFTSEVPDGLGERQQVAYESVDGLAIPSPFY